MIEYIKLGATLFVPSTHKNLSQILKQEKYPTLKSIVIDLEDGIKDEQQTQATKIIQKILLTYKKNTLLVFIRPRDPKHLEELLSFKNIEHIDGFVLPKFSLSNAENYLLSLSNTQHCFMPSIEGEELFDMLALKALKQKLLIYKQRIVLLRFGLEDMLRQLSMQRGPHKSVFDYAVCSSVLGNFLAVFKSAGFKVSGGVYPFFNNKKGFVLDLQRDLSEGLFSKTVIHPSQIDPVHEQYKVSKSEFEEAKSLLNESSGILNINNKMGEVKTMSPFAKEILLRAKIYGVRED